MRSVGQIITAIFSSLFLILTLFFLISNLNLPLNYKILLVQSGSMSPTINTGDLVIVKAGNKYKKGDVVTFISNKRFNVTHRIVDVKNNQFYTKGDANKNPDSETIKLNQILGKVSFVIPSFGYFIIFVKSIPGLILLIIIPSTIIIYQEFVQIGRHLKKS